MSDHGMLLASFVMVLGVLSVQHTDKASTDNKIENPTKDTKKAGFTDKSDNEGVSDEASDYKQKEADREKEVKNQMNEMIEDVFEQISKAFINEDIVQEINNLRDFLKEDLSKIKGSKDVEASKIIIMGIVEEFNILRTDMLKDDPTKTINAKEFPSLIEQFEKMFIKTNENVKKEVSRHLDCPQKKQLKQATERYFFNVKNVANGLFHKLIFAMKEKLHEKCPDEEIEERFMRIWEKVSHDYETDLRKEEMENIHQFIDDMENKMK